MQMKMIAFVIFLYKIDKSFRLADIKYIVKPFITDFVSIRDIFSIIIIFLYETNMFRSL